MFLPFSLCLGFPMRTRFLMGLAPALSGLALVFLSSPLASQGLEDPAKVPEGLSATDWSGIRAAYEAGRHAVHAVDGGFRAWNPGQGWHTRFDGRGFTVTPDAGGWSWGLELQSYGFPGRERTVTHPAQGNAEGGRVAFDRDATLTEWYRNDARGLEQGFTVHRPPLPEAGSPTAGPLTFHLMVRGGLSPEIAADGQGVRFLDQGGAAVIHFTGLVVLDAGGHHIPARFHRDADGLLLTVEEGGAAYPLTLDPIAQQAYLKASNSGDGDAFGSSISISGDTVVVGAPGESSRSRGVNGDQNNNRAHYSGAAYVFVRDPKTGSWSQQAYLKASNTDKEDLFGISVSVSGDTVVVGARDEDSNATGINGNQNDDSSFSAGAAYVFVRDPQAGTWSQQAYIKASNAGTWDGFGVSVSICGDTLVVGAFWEASGATGVNGNEGDNSAPNAGAAYVFVRDPQTGIWSQQAYLKASNTDGDDQFGFCVSVSTDTVVVGAPYEDSNATGIGGNEGDNSAAESGAAYVFVRDPQAGTWSQQAYLKASNTDAGDLFGVYASVSGDTLVVGAPLESSSATGVNGNQNDNNAFRSGAAYVFVRDPQAGTWSQQAYLKASNTDGDDGFGSSVAVSGDTIVVGADGESSRSRGVNGDQTDNSAPIAGAAYIFFRNLQAGTWIQQAYLKASNADGGDTFGRSVAVSGDSVVVGANYEGSLADGVNGDESNNGALRVGAAYAFINRILAASGEVLSVSSGGTIDYAIDFPFVDAGANYQILLSVHGTGPTALHGLSIPLTRDRLFRASLNGNTPAAITSGFHGTLDVFGDASAQVVAPPMALPVRLAGRSTKLYLAVVNSNFDLSSKPVTLRFTL